MAQACKRQLSISGVGSLPQLPTGFVPLRVRLELVAKDGPGNAEATASFTKGRFAASGGQSHDALWVAGGKWVGLGQFAWKLGARLAARSLSLHAHESDPSLDGFRRHSGCALGKPSSCLWWEKSRVLPNELGKRALGPFS